MLTLANDLRHAIRHLRKSPGFTLSVVAVLALGIGANASVFSALDQTVIRPLPYPDPNRLAMVSEDFSAFGMPRNRVSPATFLDWQRRTHTFSGLAALRVSVMNLTDAGAPEEVLGAAVTANLLPLVGVQPIAGRVMTLEEEAPGHRVVVLSERLWRRRFGGDTTVVGRTILMSGQAYTVVGVMPPAFHFPDAATDFWVPIALRPAQLSARNSHYLRVVGRLRPDATWSTVRDDMTGIARQLAREFPRTNDRVGITVTPLTEEVTADSARALGLLMGAAACVLLVACANVANLLLARAARRRPEIAVCLAIGASRARIVRQLLTESLLLAAAGAAAGLLVARMSLPALARFTAPALATSIALDLDARALAFTTIAALATALLFGTMPAFQIVLPAITDNLRPRSSLGADRRGTRLRRALVVVEIAVALMLVAGAGLLVETLARLRAVDPGFRSDHVLTATLTVPYPKYAEAVRRQTFYSNVLARVRVLPGVAHAGLTSDLPYTSRANYMSLTVEHQEARKGLGQDALFRLVSAGYLETIGAKLRAGRFLDEHDREGALPVVVVNEPLARASWPNETALGKRIDTGTGDGSPRWMTVVGVVDDIKERGLDFGQKAAVYVPFTQTPIAFFQPSEIAVRTTGKPEDLASALQRAVWSVDPEQPVSLVRTMDDIVDEELSNRHQMLSLLGVFALIALLLASVGVYGVLSYLVAERRREIGLRMALGASPAVMLRGILAQSAGLAGAGIVLGVAGALVTTRWLGSLLFNVSPADPIVLASVSALLAFVSLLAAAAPARRAARVDPMLALRAD